MSVLANKVVIVTGASSGIGEAAATLLARKGAKVVLAARRVDRLRQLERDLTGNGRGGRALAVECDVTSRESVRAMVDEAASVFGPVDVLVNNAGVMPLSPIEALREGDWAQMVDVNINGVLNCTAACLPHMTREADGAPRGGHIVNVSSVAGRRVFPSAAVYCGTKFFVHAFSEGLRAELCKKGVRVTIVAPGIVETELQRHIPDEELKTAFFERTKAMRKLKADDIANAICYAVESPSHVSVSEVLIRPTDQET
ncbi:MAG: SDR family oxidoreductase [Phycisphaerales bacterium]